MPLMRFALPPKQFFENLAITGDSVPFDEVLLVPRYSEVLPGEADLSTRITRDLRMGLPFLPAAMPTVTDVRMAIACAERGSMGIIPRQQDPEKQSEKVSTVKNVRSGFVKTPRTLRADKTLAEHRSDQDLRLAAGKNVFQYHPVEDSDGSLVGYLDDTQLVFHRDDTKTIGEIMTPISDKYTVKSDTTPQQAYKTLLDRAIPIIFRVRGKHLTGMYLLSGLERKFDKASRTANVDKNGRFVVGAAIGVGTKEIDRGLLLLSKGADLIVVDVAHIHTKSGLETVKILSKETPNVLTGNIATDEAARDLIRAGAAGLKVGIGPGSICTTRAVTGSGVLQLTALYWVARYAKRFGIPVCADGNIVVSGSLAKAFGVGAESGMCGSLFAGTDESPGEPYINAKGHKVKRYDGAGSMSAMNSGSGEIRYRQKTVPEGVESEVPYKGPVSQVITNLEGGLQAACGMIGAANIPAMQKQALLTRMNAAGQRESNVHDVTVVGDRVIGLM